MTDYFRVLDLPKDASEEQIRSQYRLLVRVYHPDRFNKPEDKAYAEQKIKEINEAYSVLMRATSESQDAKAEQQPVPVVIPSYIDFGTLFRGEKKIVPLSISNARGEISDLHFDFSEARSWFVLNESKLLTDSQGAPLHFEVVATTNELTPGRNYRGWIDVRMQDAVTRVNLALKIARDKNAPAAQEAPAPGTNWRRIVVLGLAAIALSIGFAVLAPRYLPILLRQALPNEPAQQAAPGDSRVSDTPASIDTPANQSMQAPSRRLLLEALVSGGAANDTFSASADQLVYPLYDNNRLVLYTSQSDGSEQHRLKLAGQALVWNRDGSKIAYLNQSEGAVQIFYTQFSDTEIVQLTNTPNHKRALNWSPTGSQLAFLQEEGKGDVLYVIDSNDPKPRSFRVFQQGTTLGFSWHPDGQSLLFAQKIGDAARVYQVNAERTDLKQLTNFESYDPAWAPDGAHFAVASIQGLMVINVDGEKRRQLVEGEVHHPLWDYNGREIAYLTPSKRPAASQNLLYDLWLISSDGSTPSQKIVEDVLNFAWSPNSPRLAYVTGVLQTSGASRLYLWTVASGEQPRLVAETSDPFIAWVP